MTKADKTTVRKWLFSYLFDWIALGYFIILAIGLFIFREWLFSLNLLEIVLLCISTGSFGGIVWGIPHWKYLIRRRHATHMGWVNKTKEDVNGKNSNK